MEENKDIKIPGDGVPVTKAEKLGNAVGAILAYTFAGCVCALLIGVTFKLLQWMLF